MAAGDQEGLLVQRYDRRQLDNDEVTRIHQEDFCQALGVLPDLHLALERPVGERLTSDLEISPAGVRRRAREIGERVLAASLKARERLAEPWRGEAVLDSIDQLVKDSAEEIRRAADEPA